MNLVFCNCAYADAVPADVKARVRTALTESGRPFVAVPDLCALAARKDPQLARWAETPGLQIVACHPRAVRWLFHAVGAPLPATGAECLNMRETAAAAIVQRILGAAAVVPLAPAVVSTGPVSVAWPPWFPVIDYERCTDCLQCLSFCPFGVYELAAGKVTVIHPEQCKNNCPACARICPETAIIFPKFPTGPVSGAPVPAATVFPALSAGTDESLDTLLAKRRARAAAFRRARAATPPAENSPT